MYILDFALEVDAGILGKSVFGASGSSSAVGPMSSNSLSSSSCSNSSNSFSSSSWKIIYAGVSLTG